MNQSLSDTAYQYILDMIFSCELTDGAKIYEQDIMDKLNISRTPVREAVQRLVSDNILDFYPRRYTQVHTFTDQEIFDLATVRISIDSLAVQLAILNGSNRDFQILSGISEDCENAALHSDVKTRIQYDCAFHNELVRIGGNQVLQSLQEKLSLRMRILQTQVYNQRQQLFCDLQGHANILEALFERDTEKAMAAVYQHLGSFYIQISSPNGPNSGRNPVAGGIPIRTPNYHFTSFSPSARSTAPDQEP